MKPSELGICSEEEDFAYMGAYTQQKRLMKAYEDKVQAAEMERRNKSLGSK